MPLASVSNDWHSTNPLVILTLPNYTHSYKEAGHGAVEPKSKWGFGTEVVPEPKRLYPIRKA